MLKHTQTIRRQKPTNCLSVFEHFLGLVLKGLRVRRKLVIKFDQKIILSFALDPDNMTNINRPFIK